MKYLELLDTVFLILKKKPLSKDAALKVENHLLIVFSLPAHLPPWRDCVALLDPVDSCHGCCLGTYLTQSLRARRHVLVLLPGVSRYQSLVETIHYPTADITIRH